jgi:phosphatidylserine synthase
MENVDAISWFALFMLVLVSITLVYAIIYIHDIPYEIAKKRNHPHQDAIHTAGWVSLFLLHTIWPFLWIWATLYKPETGWGLSDHDKLARLQEKVEYLERKLCDKEKKEEEA